jgi:hypothetical protein
MNSKIAAYRSGYKYQLAEDFHLTGTIIPKKDSDEHFLSIRMDGKLIIKKGYAWDGVSGPIQDTNENMRASLVHDAYYQLMRGKKVIKKSKSKKIDNRKKADKLFKSMLKEDGLASTTAHSYYLALRAFGGPSSDPDKTKEVLKAPQK